MDFDLMVRALGTDDDGFMEALADLGDRMCEELRAAAADPMAEPHVAKGFVCMSGGVDAFVAELERCRRMGRRLRAGASMEDAEAENGG